MTMESDLQLTFPARLTGFILAAFLSRCSKNLFQLVSSGSALTQFGAS